jgi:hypothetical protein
MLLCDIASLSRLSITIVSLTGLPTLRKQGNYFVSSRFYEAHYTIAGRTRGKMECRSEVELFAE